MAPPVGALDVCLQADLGACLVVCDLLLAFAGLSFFNPSGCSGVHFYTK